MQVENNKDQIDCYQNSIFAKKDLLKISRNFANSIDVKNITKLFVHVTLFLNVQIACKTLMNVRPPNYKLPIQAYYQTIYVRNMKIS